MEILPTKKHLGLWLEFLLLYIGVPVLLYFHGSRQSIMFVLWGLALYATARLSLLPDFSWRREWRGAASPTAAQQRMMIVRFILGAAALAGLTVYLQPARLFAFPLQRPGLWFLVMLLYPILSVLPQEILTRSYFFQRYTPLLPQPVVMLAVNVLCFSFMHIVFHNAVALLLCLVGGGLFTQNYVRYRSLKWVVIEHAAYGCAVFTVGLGQYFFFSGMYRS